MSRKWLLTGAVLFLTAVLLPSEKAFAFGFEAKSQGERIGAVAFGIVLLIIMLFAVYKAFTRSFFNGFVAAIGFFLSVDTVVFHWIFQLHRITKGPEANILEPIFVVIGAIFIWYGVRSEKKISRPSSHSSQ
ncbi:DUF2243 domain-containing protein [Fictibacillus aquaticus]|uniref:Uncharacterized protein n=1 Tax=Fictibacillus aquaticus TaxID=2021314 RepID=A0A235FCT6_9BACL|nr:DUF2243 domain-containing protein [Fictibacillus aquaticus]OYD59136.1 hypothetical protein CGZ90_04355 [Fictibacillus aquaticus]